MAEKVQLDITIAPDGTVTLTTHGLKGESCVVESEAFEKVVGKVKKRTKTSEWFQTSTKTHGTSKTRKG